VLRCPWHGWEFEISTGQSFAERRIRARTYRTAIEDGRVVVYL
jgi:nitrite reductase/ring-hydroxylating ferredoxin subunit